MTRCSKLFISILAHLWLCSCQHKYLWDVYGVTAKIRVEFDWRNAPDANPEGMCVFFYPIYTPGSRSTEPQRFDFSGRKGRIIEIPVGCYHVVCYNNDTEAILFRGEDTFHTLEAYTRNGSIFEAVDDYSRHSALSRSESSEDEAMVISPDMLYGCAMMDIEITETEIRELPSSDDSNGGAPNSRTPPLGGELTGTTTITLYPRELTCNYTYEICDVVNLHRVVQMCATLSGMASSLNLGYDRLSLEPVTIPFPARHDSPTSISGDFITFGHHAELSKPHNLRLYVWLFDGKKLYYDFDVTEQVNSAPDPRRVHIKVAGLTLPEPDNGDEGSGGGFDPSVDDFEEEEGVDIVM